MFPGESLPQVKSPLDKNDHPELDNSELASDDLITKFMCMVGQLQWAVTLGKYDILAHVMSMSRFRLAPKVGHIERIKRIYGYLSRTKHYALRFRTDEPNFMHLPDLEYDWTRIYGNVLEEIPKDAPEPLGKSVTTTTFLDANLLHDLITGRSTTAVLHFFNLTPGDWDSNRQATVENATYGSEFVAAKTATEQIIDIRQTLRYLGVPIKSKAYMLELASDDLITKFMCMVGQLQWAVTLGKYDILAHVMSMSRFRLAPKAGHIERMKRIYGYLSRTKHYALRFRTDEPNYMDLPDLEYDWTRIYGHVLEEIPKDAPEPLGKSVTTTTLLDANLLHDLITGRTVTAVLHFFNLKPGDWYSKRQATVENATYGSEFVAVKTATEQIIDIRQTLRYLGVHIKSKAYMLDDNKSVVTSTTVPHSLLSKRHNILSYHRVREAIAAKILVFHWCDSSQNKSDILSKHWEFSKVFHIIRDLFDFQGKISLIQ